MTSAAKVVRNFYRDSVALMQLSSSLRKLPHIRQASAVMASEANLALLREAGLLAGAVEAGVCALAIRDAIAPVNANFLQPDPGCDVDVVRGKSRPLLIRAALSNSFGFGGSNNCLAFRRPEDA